eukprot:gene4498-8949_t
MPFEITNGTEAITQGGRRSAGIMNSNESKRLPNDEMKQRKSDKQTNLVHRVYLAQNGMMDDVINFKVYKLSSKTQKNGRDNQTESGNKVLLGESFLNAIASSDTDNNKSRKTVNTNSTLTTENPFLKHMISDETKNSIIYQLHLAKANLKSFRREYNQVNTDEYWMEFIHDSEKRALKSRIGKESKDSMTPRTLQETLDWALEYIKDNESKLEDELLLTVEEIQMFLQKKKEKQKSSNQYSTVKSHLESTEKSTDKDYETDSPGFDSVTVMPLLALKEKQNSFAASTATATATKETVKLTLSEKLDQIAQLHHQKKIIKKHIEHVVPRRKYSNSSSINTGIIIMSNMTKESIPEYSFARPPSDSRRASHTFRRKSSAISSTSSNNAYMSGNAGEMRDKNTRSSAGKTQTKGHSAAGQFASPSRKNMQIHRQQHPSQRMLHIITAAASGSNHNSQRTLSRPGIISRSNFSEDMCSVSVDARSNRNTANTNAIAPRRPATATATSSSQTSSELNGNYSVHSRYSRQSRYSSNTHRRLIVPTDVETAAAAAGAGNVPNIIYSTTVISQEEKVRQVFQKHDEIRQEQRTENIKLFEEISHKAEGDGKQMLKCFETFSNTQKTHSNITKSIFETKEFQRPEIMRLKFELLEKLQKKLEKGTQLKGDLKIPEKDVKRLYYHRCIQNISKFIWFPTCISKLKEACKRKRQSVPLSCLKFLGVLRCLFTNGKELNSELFYYIMERTIKSEDHAQLEVYKTLKCAFDSININSESFLQYLENRDIQPCAEHLSYIKRIREADKQKRKSALMAGNENENGNGLQQLNNEDNVGDNIQNDDDKESIDDSPDTDVASPVAEEIRGKPNKIRWDTSLGAY